MKLHIIFCTAVLAFVATPALADRAEKVDKFLDKMKTELDLSAEQIEDIKPILKEYNTEIKDERKDRENDLEEVLTEEQMEKFKAMKEDAISDIKSKAE